MNSYKLTIVLHPSIQSKQHILEGKIVSKTTLLEGILSVLSSNEDVFNFLVVKNNIKPGFLLLSSKVELKSTGMLNSEIKSDFMLKIIPISHGG